MTEKQKNTPYTNVGGAWYLQWVLFMSLAVSVVGIARIWLINGFGVASWPYGVLNLALPLLVVGAQAYQLPRPVRRDWLLWLGLVFLATLATSVIYGVSISVLMRFFGTELFASTSFPIVYSMVANVISVAVIGGAGWFILQRHVERAVAWFGALLLSGLARIPLEVIAGILSNSVNQPWIGFVATVLSGVLNALVLGAALWWLCANHLKPADGKAKRRPSAVG